MPASHGHLVVVCYTPDVHNIIHGQYIAGPHAIGQRFQIPGDDIS